MQHENPLLLADLKELTEEKEELIERRVSRGWKQIGKMPEDAEVNFYGFLRKLSGWTVS